MTPVTKCLECGTDIPAEAKGLCPKCLLKLGLASQLAAGFIETGVQPPPFLGFDPAHPGRRTVFEAFEFGGYVIQSLLGKGGMGAVYEAEEIASGRRVALKVLSHSLDSADTRKRFIREGRLAASINHPNSVYVYGTEEIQGTPVITMELVPGGTLHERVKKNGPMPVDEAVSAILQVIAGLEAAHKVGILHRDIKPSNCFIEPSGTVKIGDFGLSISTLARGDSAVTLAGSVLGTPAFSSPEQLRGEELNVRSDIYSVGMTLYYLLTGRTAFEAENMIQLLATVLDKAASSPRSLRKEIPEGLAQIILRCLAKPAGERFGSYGELRDALLPFHQSPQPAPLRLRALAMAIDYGLLSLVSYVIRQLCDFENKAWATIIHLGLIFTYFGVTEGVWGRSRGKALVGLKVVDLNCSAPGVPRALLRTFLHLPFLAAVHTLPVLLILVTAVLAMSLITYSDFGWVVDFPEGSIRYFWIAAINAMLIVGCACTMRRRNGYALVHDLWTRTRVIRQLLHLPRTAMELVEESDVPLEAKPQLGPYHIVAALGSHDYEQLFVGYDPKLLRRVWIRKFQGPTPPVSLGMRNVARSGRLRWLQGQRTESEGWDAYEFIPGQPLRKLLTTPQRWETVRYWLLDLSEELEAASRDATLPKFLALDHVWITADGRAKLLDFPAPEGGRCTTAVDATLPQAKAIFLKQVAISALEGRDGSADADIEKPVAVPLPISAMRFVNELCSPEVSAISERLRPLVQQQPVVSHGKRFGLVVGCLIPSFLMGIILLHTVGHMGESEEPMELENLKEWIFELERSPIIHLENHSEVSDSVIRQNNADAYEAAIVVHFGDFIRNPATWNSSEALELSTKHRQLAEKIVRENPQPTAEQIASAVILKRSEQSPAREHILKGITHYYIIAACLIAVFGFSLISALFLRRGLLMYVLGVEVVTEKGVIASRYRIALRILIAWIPVLTFVVYIGYFAQKSYWVLSIISGLIGTALVVWSIMRRERSVQDKTAGTWLVPADYEGPGGDSLPRRILKSAFFFAMILAILVGFLWFHLSKTAGPISTE